MVPETPPPSKIILDWESDQIHRCLSLRSTHLNCVQIGHPFVAGRGAGNGRSLRELMGVVRDFKRLIYTCTLRL
jgi:hypothetical protein